MGKNASTVELLVKVWEGIRGFLKVLNESTGSFFRQVRVGNVKARKLPPCSTKKKEQRHHFIPPKSNQDIFCRFSLNRNKF